jgi:UDP-N-acetylmuramoyl-L-alanyl-D-glutamate--2,6-diaminopimelate ligase
MQQPLTNWSAIAAEVTALERRDASNSRATPTITAIEYDSRRLQPGAIFVAMRGGVTDGNRYLQAAIDAGAAAILTDSREAFAALAVSAPQLPCLLVPQGRHALAQAASAFYGHPELLLRATGITGTNGKPPLHFSPNPCFALTTEKPS